MSQFLICAATFWRLQISWAVGANNGWNNREGMFCVVRLAIFFGGTNIFVNKWALFLNYAMIVNQSQVSWVAVANKSGAFGTRVRPVVSPLQATKRSISGGEAQWAAAHYHIIVSTACDGHSILQAYTSI